MAADAMRLAKRLDEVGFSDIVQVRNKVMELRAAGQAVHAFHTGEPFFETPSAVKYALLSAAVENKTRYAPSSGIEPLRQAIAAKMKERNGLEVSAENVIVTAGGAHALYVAFQAVLDPGDDVLLFSPYWTPIREMITACQARALLVPTATARSAGLTRTLEDFTTPHTRAIYYNTPQNPTGTVFSRAEAEEVAAFAQKHDLVVIADEAYEDLVYEGEHFSIASLPGMAQRTISAYTFSKTYGMTGWRVGYAVASEPFMTGLRKLVLYTVTKISKDSRNAARMLLTKAHVATIPGVVFGGQGEGHVRFGYAIDPRAIEEGLAALKKYLVQ
jgi:aspartate aminotransferase